MIELNDGDFVLIGGVKLLVKDGWFVPAPVVGPHGGELVRYDSLKKGDLFTLTFEKINDQINKCVTPGFKASFNNDDIGVLDDDFVEVNIPDAKMNESYKFKKIDDAAFNA